MSNPLTRVLPQSIRWRLQLWQACLLAFVLTGFGFTVYQRERQSRFSQIDGELDARITILNNAVRNAPFSLGSPGGKRQPSSSSVEGAKSGRRPPPPSGRRGPPPGPRPDGPPPGPRPSGPPPIRRFDDRPPDHDPGSSPSTVSGKPRDFALSEQAAESFAKAGYYYAIWYRDGSLLKRSTDAPESLARPGLFERDTLTHLKSRDGFREAVHCSGLGDCFLVGRSRAPDSAALRNLATVLTAAGLTILAFGIAVGSWLITLAIRPIDQIGATAMRISHGNLSERIPVDSRKNELAHLAGVLNSMFARLDSAFARQRQFTADAAHELRTPLAVIITETQTALTRERSADQYRTVVEGCLTSAQEMRRLTESLLILSRFDDGDDGLARTAVDLAETARLLLGRMTTVAAQRGITLQTELKPARAFTNADRLRLVITNLVTNAIEYTGRGGTVHVSTFSAEDGAVLKVSDTGVGIPAEDLPRIFDRFFRVDKVRSRADGHIGLGLAICKAIVEIEGGRIGVMSTPGNGSVFTVRLPSHPE